MVGAGVGIWVGLGVVGRFDGGTVFEDVGVAVANSDSCVRSCANKACIRGSEAETV